MLAWMCMHLFLLVNMYSLFLTAMPQNDCFPSLHCLNRTFYLSNISQLSYISKLKLIYKALLRKQNSLRDPMCFIN